MRTRSGRQVETMIFRLESRVGSFYIGVKMSPKFEKMYRDQQNLISALGMFYSWDGHVILIQSSYMF